MNSQKNLKIKGVLIAILVSLFLKVSGQGFNFDTKDPSTYNITCGEINGAFWGVKNDTCTLFTPFLHPIDIPADSVTIVFQIRIGQTGNLESDDSIHIYTQMTSNSENKDGTWSLIKTWNGTQYNEVLIYNDSIKIALTDSFRVIICMHNDYSQGGPPGWWQIFDSNGILVDGVWYGDDPMPVELLNFNASAGKDFVLLRWVTASETNNDYFTIEKSADSFLFEELAYVDGAGNSNNLKEYCFKDDVISANAYYRLKQTDFDGKCSFSQIIKVSEIDKNANTIFVNNIGDHIDVVANSKSSGRLQLNIYSVVGQLVFENTVNVEEGGNTFLFEPGIESGTNYILCVSINNELPIIKKIYLN